MLFWELGNELNLAWDGCCYDKSDGSFFSSKEGLLFLQSYALHVKGADPFGRPVSRSKSVQKKKQVTFSMFFFLFPAVYPCPDGGPLL